MMTDPLKNGVLAVQTIRKDIMASTLLATTAITLTSIMSVVVSTTSSSSTSSSLVYGSKTKSVSSIKYFTILVCFLFALDTMPMRFIDQVLHHLGLLPLCVRYYAHARFLVSVSPPRDAMVFIDYVGQSLSGGSIFWSLGLLSFYVSFSLFLWIFGPIPKFVCCRAMSFLLYFLDSSSDFSRQLHDLLGSEEEQEKTYDVESQQAD